MTDRIEVISASEEWNELLRDSPHATPFHLAECLQSCAEHMGARCHFYVGYKGQEPTGLFPIFELQKGPFTGVFSPPPELKIPYLGPALLAPAGMKRRKLERWNRNFIDSVVERVETDLEPRYWQIRTSPKFHDERPFLWNDYEETLRHTYTVELPDSEQDLGGAFSADARKNAFSNDASEVSEEGTESAERVIETVADRHADQGVPFTLSPSFVSNLYHRLPDGCMRVYVCRRDDQFLGGDITLELGDTVYGWFGASDLSTDLPVKDILYGFLLRDAHRRGYERYDMVGANDPRLSNYKAKFGPELRGYTQLVRRGVSGRLAASLYDLIG